MKNNKSKVVITSLSNRAYYYQWFLYGMQLMKRNGEISLEYKIPLSQRLTLTTVGGLVCKIYEKVMYKLLGSKFSQTKKSRNFFLGYVESNGIRKTFCMDSADAPFLFSGKLLKECDVYFKMQCPKTFDKAGFPLGHVRIPYSDYDFADPKDEGKVSAPRKICPEVFEYNDKIKPLLIATRKLTGFGNGFARLDAAYKNLLQSREVKQTKKVMCYFGNSKGPKPSGCTENPDFDWEADIISYFGDKIHHPNEKRAKIADILNELGEGYDGRIINRGFSDTGLPNTDASKIVPLKDFSKFVAQFEYNFNISGYRMSIPNRFMDSFVCGTAIVTDNLEVKWYKPFGNEVVEIGDMGYLPDSEVDYDGIKETIKQLKPISKQSIIDRYEKNWSPIACARYIAKTCVG